MVVVHQLRLFIQYCHNFFLAIQCRAFNLLLQILPRYVAVVAGYDAVGKMDLTADELLHRLQTSLCQPAVELVTPLRGGCPAEGNLRDGDCTVPAYLLEYLPGLAYAGSIVLPGGVYGSAVDTEFETYLRAPLL